MIQTKFEYKCPKQKCVVNSYLKLNWKVIGMDDEGNVWIKKISERKVWRKGETLSCRVDDHGRTHDMRSVR